MVSSEHLAWEGAAGGNKVLWKMGISLCMTLSRDPQDTR